MSGDEFVQASVPVLWSKVGARKWIVIACAASLLAVSGVVGISWPKKYVSTSVVTVSPITITPFASTPINQQINIETERSVVASTSVASSVAQSIPGSPSNSDLLEHLQVSSPPDSQVLRIGYTDAAPERAAQIANAFARVYLQRRAAAAEDLAQRIIKQSQDRIDDLTASLPKQPSAQNANITASIRDQINTLQDQQRQLSSVGLNPGQIIGPANVPTTPSSPRLLLFLVAGVALGLLSGLILALLREQTDRRVRRADRLADAVRTPVVIWDDSDPFESGRRLLMIVSADHEPADDALGAARPLVTDVTSVDATVPAVPVSRALGAVSRESGRSSLVLRLEDSEAWLVDGGWPSSEDRSRWDADLIVLDSRRLLSETRQQLVAQRSDRIVLCVGARSWMEDVERWTTDLGREGITVTACVFLHQRRRSLRGTWTSRRASTSEVPQPSPKPESDADGVDLHELNDLPLEGADAVEPKSTTVRVPSAPMAGQGDAAHGNKVGKPQTIESTPRQGPDTSVALRSELR